jgi:hypothetical protein
MKKPDRYMCGNKRVYAEDAQPRRGNAGVGQLRYELARNRAIRSSHREPERLL